MIAEKYSLNCISHVFLEIIQLNILCRLRCDVLLLDNRQTKYLRRIELISSCLSQQKEDSLCELFLSWMNCKNYTSSGNLDFAGKITLSSLNEHGMSSWMNYHWWDRSHDLFGKVLDLISSYPRCISFENKLHLLFCEKIFS